MTRHSQDLGKRARLERAAARSEKKHAYWDRIHAAQDRAKAEVRELREARRS